MSNRHAIHTMEDPSRQSARQVAQDIKQEGDALIKDAAGKISPIVSAMREKASVISEQLRERARDNAQSVDRYVHENPWSFVGLGLVTGFLATWYLLRRDR